MGEMSEGDFIYKLKTTFSDGTTAIKLSPKELLEKIAALIPPPKAHLTLYSGVFAPSAKLRNIITLKPEIKKGKRITLEANTEMKVSLKESCKSPMQITAAVTDVKAVAHYLTHIGLSAQTSTDRSS